jgi:hypothetical protein
MKNTKKKSPEESAKSNSHNTPGAFTNFSNLSILNSNDNRDIYHDFYKIANINGHTNSEDRKK